MTFWEVTVAHDGRGVEIAWREGGGPWTVIGERAGQRFRVSVPAQGRFTLRGIPVDRDGRSMPDQMELVDLDATARVTDRPDPSTLDLPEPEVAQEGSAFLVTLRPPLGQSPDEYRWECRHSLDEDAPEDAKQVGIFAFGEQAREDAWSGMGAQKIHVRVIRKADGVAGAWVSSEITPKDATEADTEDHSADFGSGTIVPISEDGPEPMEIAAGNLRTRVALTRADAGDATRASATAAGTTRRQARCSAGRYRTPTIVLPEVQAFALEFMPSAATIARPSPTRAEARNLRRRVPELASDDSPLDSEVDRMSATRGFAQEPVRAELLVATSQSASPTFVDADYKPHVPGKVQFVRSYACEVGFRSLFGLVVEFDKLRIRRELVCRRCDARTVHVRKVKGTHGFMVGKPVYINGSGDYALAKADAAGTIAVGLVSLVPNSAAFFVCTSGIVWWPGHGLTTGARYYLSAVTGGALTTTRPTGGNYAQSVLVPLNADEVMVQIGQGELT